MTVGIELQRKPGTSSTMKLGRLGDHVEILSGFAFDSSRFADAGDMPLIRIRDVVRGRTETYYSGPFGERFVVRKGDLLVGMDGDFNREIWSSEPALLNQRVCRISPLGADLDLRYLYHFLPQALTEIWHATPFATVKHLSVKAIREIALPLPPLDEQRRIAAILDKADELRVKRRQALALLTTYTQSVFHTMFGNVSLNDRGWEEARKLADVAEVCSGITKGRKTSGQVLTTVPYMAVSNVQDMSLSLKAVKYIDATAEEIDRLKLRRDDLLLTEGGDPDKLGRGTLWTEQLPLSIHQNHVFRVRVIAKKEVHPLFLNWLVGSSRGKSYFLKSAKQTTGIASINMTQLKAFPLLVPPFRLQADFAKRVEVIDRLKDHHSAQLAELDALFAVLQHRAFRGEL